MTNAVSDHEEVARLKSELAEARAELTGARLLIEQLKGQLAILRRMQFGRSSEKLTAEIQQLELLLEDLEEGEAERTAPTTATAGTSQRRHPARKPLPDHLPHEDVIHHPGDTCPCCGGTRLSKLGEDVTEVLERIPAKLKVIRHIRPRLSCRSCETIIQAPAPDLPIEKGQPGPALIANIVVGKYIDGLPLYRKASSPVMASISTGQRCVTGLAALRGGWCQYPTPLPVTSWRRRSSIPTTPRSACWHPAGAGPEQGERPAEHLRDFAGCIHADGGACPRAGQRPDPGAGYEALTRGPAPPGGPATQKIAHAACWVHARRKLYDVHERSRSPIAAEGLRRIGALYDIEREIGGLSPERRLAIRQERSASLLADLRTWMETERRRLSSKSDLAKALQYALGRWTALIRFTTDGRLAIDNNAAERALRGIAVTRKNLPVSAPIAAVSARPSFTPHSSPPV